MLIIYSYL